MSNTGMRYNVFVYGSLKKGFHNHGILSKSENTVYVGKVTTKEKRFTMAGLGSFPAGVVVDSHHKHVDSFHIEGELYLVDDDTFKMLDVLEGYPKFYNRILVETKHMKAWMYVQYLSLYEIKEDDIFNSIYKGHNLEKDNIQTEDDVIRWI